MVAIAEKKSGEKIQYRQEIQVGFAKCSILRFDLINHVHLQYGDARGAETSLVLQNEDSLKFPGGSLRGDETNGPRHDVAFARS